MVLDAPSSAVMGRGGTAAPAWHCAALGHGVPRHGWAHGAHMPGRRPCGAARSGRAFPSTLVRSRQLPSHRADETNGRDTIVLQAVVFDIQIDPGP